MPTGSEAGSAQDCAARWGAPSPARSPSVPTPILTLIRAIPQTSDWMPGLQGDRDIPM